jgi:hypothetical protein
MSSQVNPSSAHAQAPGAVDERRAFPRYPVDWDVVCKALAGGRADAWQARLRDVSAGGLGVVMERRFERGTTLTVQVQNAGSDAPRTLIARVMHATRLPEGEWLLGLSLLRQLSEDQLRAWGVDPLQADASDTRAWVRVACDLDAVCQEVGPGASAPWQARVLNLSPSGIGLVAPSPLARGSHLTVDLRGTGRAGARRLFVRVAQLQEQKDGTWVLGCEFAQRLSEADLSALQAGQEIEADTTAGLPAEPEAKPAESRAPVPQADPDLARLCAAWPSLPGHVRAKILALVAQAH